MPFYLTFFSFFSYTARMSLFSRISSAQTFLKKISSIKMCAPKTKAPYLTPSVKMPLCILLWWLASSLQQYNLYYYLRHYNLKAAWSIKHKVIESFYCDRSNLIKCHTDVRSCLQQNSKTLKSHVSYCRQELTLTNKVMVIGQPFKTKQSITALMTFVH